MCIHANPGPSGEIFLRFCSQPAPFLQIRCFGMILSLETMPHGGTFVYYLFLDRFTYIYSQGGPRFQDGHSSTQIVPPRRDLV